jgi:hypothetical protein
MTIDGTRTLAARVLLLVTTALVALPGCSATRLTDIWAAPGPAGGPFRQVAVFAFGGSDADNRIAEAEFVHRLPASTRGEAGHGLVPRAELGDVGRVRERLRAGGFDSVIVVWMAGGAEARTPPVSYRTFGDTYAAMLQDAQRVGDRRGARTRLHAFVYRATDDALVWSAAGRSVAPDDLYESTAAVARVVMERLQEAGLLAES